MTGMDRTARRWATGLALAALLGGAGCSKESTPTPSAASLPSSGSASDPAPSTSSEPSGGSPDPTDASDPTLPTSSSTTARPRPPVPSGDVRLAPGPVTYLALGDSLTAGDGDDEGVGYVGRIAAQIDAAPGRSGTEVVNLGRSGWDSSSMADGQEGGDSQLERALAEARDAAAEGRAVLATVLIGSNDLWYVYEYGAEEGTPTSDEDTAATTYRTNLERTVEALQEAGAVVVIGLPDDQSLRPGAASIERLNEMLPATTADEVDRMAVLAGRLGDIATEVGAERGAPIVDTNDPFWADPAAMADDGIHPNGDGYATLAERWMQAIGPLL